MISALSSAPISLDNVRAHFDDLLRATGAALEAPTLNATWRAFAQFARVAVVCDEESLFFECGPSPSDENRFYVNFTRTFFGRDAGNHFWSSELNCDFLFENTEALEELGTTIEAEEFAHNSDEIAEFFAQVEAQSALWRALEGRESLAATIYFGES